MEAEVTVLECGTLFVSKCSEDQLCITLILLLDPTLSLSNNNKNQIVKV